MPQNANWDSDGVGGRPSSLDVLLGWLAVPGNAGRCFAAEGRRNRPRGQLLAEILELLRRQGITYRNHAGIDSKLRGLLTQFQKAEEWLKARGLRNLKAGRESERAVLTICPHYRSLAPLLRASHFSAAATPHDMTSDRSPKQVRSEGLFQFQFKYHSTAEWHSAILDDSGSASESTGGSESESSDEESASDQATCVAGVTRRHKEKHVDRSCSKWDSDGVNGRLSSLDVLLKWILTPGNAPRWLQAARKTGSRLVLGNEIYDLLLIHGITHRTPRGAVGKLLLLEEQFDKAANWLTRNGIQHFKDSAKAELMVLQLCPLYAKIEPLLRSALYSAASARCQTRRSISTEVRFKPVAEPAAQSPTEFKRRRIEHQANAEHIRPVAILRADPDERREFFKLELQVKRDEAVLVRAKARKELQDMGLSMDDINRLLPL
jgi:hypothetical protein